MQRDKVVFRGLAVDYWFKRHECLLSKVPDNNIQRVHVLPVYGIDVGIWKEARRNGERRALMGLFIYSAHLHQRVCIHAEDIADQVYVDGLNTPGWNRWNWEWKESFYGQQFRFGRNLRYKPGLRSYVHINELLW